jgi:hypothetical protein
MLGDTTGGGSLFRAQRLARIRPDRPGGRSHAGREGVGANADDGNGEAIGSKRRQREPRGSACRRFEILPLDTLENATYKTKRLINLMVQYVKPADQVERRRRISRASSDDLADWSERYRNILKERLDRLDQYLRYPQTPEGEEEKSHGRRKRRKQRHL